MKHALAPLAVLVALTATACGSDDETSDAASDPATSSSSSPSTGGEAEAGTQNAFCTALVGNGALEDGEDVVALRDGLEASGIPEDAPQEATQGFDVYLDILADIDADATAEDLASMEDFDLSDGEQQQVNALVQYAGATCAPAAPEGGTGQEQAPEGQQGGQQDGQQDGGDSEQ